MQILKMHNLTQNYRINLAARGILQSHGTLRHMTDESNNGISRCSCWYQPAMNVHERSVLDASQCRSLAPAASGEKLAMEHY